MAGYIGSKTSVTQVDGYNRTEADDEFVNDPNSVISVSGSSVGIGTSSPTTKLQSKGGSISTPTNNAGLIANASASFVVDHGNDYGIYTGYVNSTNDAVGIAATRTLGSALPLSLQPFGGNVGIGTSLPSTPSGSCLSLYNATLPRLNFKNSTTGDGTFDGFELYMQGTLAGVNNKENGAIAFGTNDSERMRLTNGGYLAVGNTLLPTSGTAGVSLAPEGNVHCGVATTADTNVMRFDNPNGRVGSISTVNSSTSYNTSSDYRLKTDAQPMTGASERVQELNPVNFEWVVDGTRTDGFLAHEAQAVVPEAVTGTKDAMRDEEYEVTPAVLDDDGNVVTEAVMGTRSVPDYQGIDQSKLVPLLTAALQEALTKIDTMETRLAALEAV